ncbi:MAG: FtsX-like permease family protein [Aliifodinibius sp.]|nr:FtsX-like permease family protein [Fodinibius sp.]
MVNLFSGYLQIQKAGYQQNPTLQKSFRFDQEIKQSLNQTEGVTGYTPRIMGDGLISYKDNSLGAGLLGIVPESEKEVSTMMTKIHKGRFFKSDTGYEIVVGYKLLDNLKASIGDTVVVLSQGFDGSLGNLLFKIVGTIKSGVREFDAHTIFMGLSTAQELLTMYGRINVVAVELEELDQIKPLHKKLQQNLADPGLTVLKWNEIMPSLEQSIELDNIGGILFLAILVLVVAFGIMNTVLMSVTERFREFGITLAIGMPNRKLVLMVIFETLFIALLGIIIGNILAYGINYYIVQNPIILGGQFEQLYAEYGFLPRLESTLKANIFLNSSIITLIISVIAGIYPAIKVFKLEPLKGIRYTLSV